MSLCAMPMLFRCCSRIGNGLCGCCAVQYEFPANKPISEECKDLLARIFVADPTQRISVRDIHHHPWFRHGIPPDLDVDQYNANWTMPTQSAERAESVRGILRDALQTSPAATSAPAPNGFLPPFG